MGELSTEVLMIILFQLGLSLLLFQPPQDPFPVLLERFQGQRLDQWLTHFTAANPTPVVEGQSAYFLFRADGGEPPKLIGDFNLWGDERLHGEPRGEAMQALGDSGWFLSTKVIPVGARLEYLFQIEGTGVIDPLNPRQEHSFSGTVSVLEMAGYPAAPEIGPHRDLPKGRIDRFELDSKERQNRR